MRRPRRPAYTLLEVILALLIGVLLLAALYGAVGYQLRQAQAGRDLVAQTTLVRSIVSRLESDVSATIGLNNPARFRDPANTGGGCASGAASATPTAGTTSATTPTPAGTSSAAATTGNTTSTSSTSGQSGTGSAVVLPLGVIGDSSSLTLYVSRLPSEAWPSDNNNQGAVVSDLRRVTYWMDSGGLCRQEVRVITSADAQDTSVPPSGADPAQCRLAREVKSIEISYYDGTSWQDSWDSTTLGTDGVTPIGSPRAIAIRIGLQSRLAAGNGKDGATKHYRHVIEIQTANGATQANNNVDPTTGTSQSSTGAGSSP